jgi:LysM domain
MAGFPPLSVHQPAGGTDIWGNFDIALAVGVPSTLRNPYHAARYYGDANKCLTIFEANRLQIQDPNRIFAGQVLRIPSNRSAR